MASAVLEARGIVFGYQRDTAILDGWSEAFAAGTMTALTGPSGRGKSTLLYLLGLMLSAGRCAPRLPRRLRASRARAAR